VTVFWRYWLLQVPGWGLLLSALLAAHRYLDLPPLWAAAIFLAWFLKDWALYPILKDHYRFHTKPSLNGLVGRKATAREALRPSGYVEVSGVLWFAEVIERGASVEPGEEVKIESIDGLTLKVRPGPKAI
jgi:membrane protein implicated in regulation of membrane protease activity